MHVTLTREGGPSTIMDIPAARKLLAANTDFLSVGARVGCGRPVDVMLADGTAAQLQLTEEKIQPELEPDWPVQILRDHSSGSLQPFSAHCKVMLDLSVAAQCMAIDETHAERIIQDVFRGVRTPPAGFRVIFDADETRDFMEKLKSVLQTGELAKAGVVDVLVTGFSGNEPQLLLEYRP